MKTKLLLLVVIIQMIFLQACGAPVQITNINGDNNKNNSDGNTEMDSQKQYDIPDDEAEISILNEEIANLKSENNELKQSNKKLQEDVDQIKKLLDDKNNIPQESNLHNEETDNKSSTIYYLSEIEELGTQGESPFCYFEKNFTEFAKDNTGTQHSNGLIFYGHYVNSLSKTYYNNGKYKSLGGTFGLTQAHKDAKLMATLKIYGIRSDNSSETVYTSIAISNSILPVSFKDLDISQYEIVKIETYFDDSNGGDYTAVGLYDSYFK